MTVDKIPIGKFSEITRLSKKALYCYEKKGILVPVQKDICTGYRYYTPLQIEKGIWIKALSALGFRLDEIEVITGPGDKNCTEVREMMSRRLNCIRDEIERLKMAEKVLSSEDPFGELFKMELINWKIKEIPQQRVLAIRGHGPYNEIIGELIGRVCAEAGSKSNSSGRMKVTGPVMAIYEGEDCDDLGGSLEVALPVSGPVTIFDPDISLKTIPGGKTLTVIHKGSYNKLGMAHKKVFDYINENGLNMHGTGRELYLNDPSNTPEEDLLTEIQYPLED